MVTLTTRHYLPDPISVTLDQAIEAWAKMMRHRRWKSLKKRLGVAGYVRAVEVTWGNVNGWHPHLHALLFVDAQNAAQVQQLEDELYALWSLVLASVGARSVTRANGVRVTRGGSAEYVAKVQEHDRGTGLEMARLDLKRGRQGSLTPFELLDETRHRRRWIAYVEATKGRRAITWSRGLRTLLGMDVEQTDDEVIAETESSELVGVLDGPEYDQIKNDPAALAGVLERAEREGNVNGCDDCTRMDLAQAGYEMPCLACDGPATWAVAYAGLESEGHAHLCSTCRDFLANGRTETWVRERGSS